VSAPALSKHTFAFHFSGLKKVVNFKTSIITFCLAQIRQDAPSIYCTYTLRRRHSLASCFRHCRWATTSTYGQKLLLQCHFLHASRLNSCDYICYSRWPTSGSSDGKRRSCFRAQLCFASSRLHSCCHFRPSRRPTSSSSRTEHCSNSSAIGTRCPSFTSTCSTSFCSTCSTTCQCDICGAVTLSCSVYGRRTYDGDVRGFCRYECGCSNFSYFVKICPSGSSVSQV
jgi:hypothetical protein